MPTNEIKKDAREGKGTVPSLEKKWDKAKDASKKSTGKGDDWALTNYIYEKERDASVLNAGTRILAANAGDAIRDAIAKAPHSPIKKPFPIVAHFNGTSVPFLAYIARVATGPEQARGLLTRITLTTIRWGLLVKGHPKCWIASQYTLTGKNELVEAGGLPKSVGQHEAEHFFHQCGVPVPPHHE